MAQRKRPTAADVARRSGVSTATVSYVLNDTPGQSIPGATRERVVEAARELNYIPNAYAQALARGSSRVAVIDLSAIPYGTTFSRAGRALAQDLEAQGYLPILNNPERSADDSYTTLESLVGILAPHIVITVVPLPHDAQEHLRAAGVRDFRTMMPSREALEENIRSAARAQVHFLHSRGHRAIAYCGSDNEALARFDELRRATFFTEGATLSVGLVDLGSHHRAEDVARALASRADLEPHVTAVAAYNDEVAFLVLSAARRLGMRVPEELAVIGTDDIPLAAEIFPPLTTVTLGDPDAATTEQLNNDLHALTPRVVVRQSA